MNLIWGEPGTTLFDTYSLHHIVWFIAITTMLYVVFKRHAWMGVIGIAFMWEVFEHWVVQNIPNFPYAGNELFINKIIGDTISDLIGFSIAMLAIRSIRKSNGNERRSKTSLEKEREKGA
jgi:hypothetical protein